jgi:hypothetical protein
MMANDNHLVRSSPISPGDHPPRSRDPLQCPSSVKTRSLAEMGSWSARVGGMEARAVGASRLR